MNTNPIARRYRVLGRVQGVYYRGSAQAEAERLGLVGWVRNLVDGGVEAYACGEAQALDSFEAWLWRGPRHARVADVIVSAAAVEALAGFEVR